MAKNHKFSSQYFYGAKKQKNENVALHSGLLTSYLSLCELQIVYGFV